MIPCWRQPWRPDKTVPIARSAMASAGPAAILPPATPNTQNTLRTQVPSTPAQANSNNKRPSIPLSYPTKLTNNPNKPNNSNPRKHPKKPKKTEAQDRDRDHIHLVSEVFFSEPSCMINRLKVHARKNPSHPNPENFFSSGQTHKKFMGENGGELNAGNSPAALLR
jgi:hypothetical protein